MNYFQEYERLKETKQLIPIGSVWEDGLGQVEVKGFDGTIVIFKDIDDVAPPLSGEYFDWNMKRFIRKFKRVT